MRALDPKTALLALYHLTNGPMWVNNSGWSQADNKSECDWYGITCDGNQTIVKINLDWNNLNGSLPTSFFHLTTVTELDLGANNLTGSIPEEISQMAELRKLDLDQNKLTGSIPRSIVTLSRLRVLFLQINRLSGTIPTDIGKMTDLQVLVLDRNNLSGPLPHSIGELTKVTAINVDFNMLTGQIPRSLVNLSLLNLLYLNNNRLTGTIPVEIGQLASLSLLYLHMNRLTGRIPISLGALSNVTDLSLHENQLSGVIPHQIGQMTKLNLLNLGKNRLTGKIPAQLGHLTLLRQLWLGHNALTGNVLDVLPTLANLTRMTRLYLDNTALSGYLPWVIGNLTSMFPKLNSLSLNTSRFSLSFRQEWVFPNTSQLVFLDLSGTDLNNSVLTSARLLRTPSVLDMHSTSLLCPLPEFPDGATVNLDSPLPCKLDLSLLEIEGIVIGALLLIAVIFLLVMAWQCSVLKLMQFRRRARLGVKVLVYFGRVAGLVSGVVWFASALASVRQLQQTTTSCAPLGVRSVFEQFVPWRFIDAHTKQVVPSVNETNLTFCQYIETVANYGGMTISSIFADVRAFRRLCTSQVQGCAVETDYSVSERCLSCVPDLIPPTLPVLQCTPTTLEALTCTLLVIICGKELIKLLLLIRALSRSTDTSPNSYVAMQRWQRHFVASSVFLPVVYFLSGPRGKYVTLAAWNHRGAASDYLAEFWHGAVLHTIPLLLLSLYYQLFVIQTGLGALATATVPLAAMSTGFILLQAARFQCQKFGKKRNNAITTVLQLLDGSDDDPPEPEVDLSITRKS